MHLPLIVVVLICVALMVVGVSMGKPPGWFVLALAILALLLAVLGKGFLNG